MEARGTIVVCGATGRQGGAVARHLLAVVVIAARYRARDVLTLDERHFRAMRGPGGRPFRVLPADA